MKVLNQTEIRFDARSMNENFARFMKSECPDVPFEFVPGEGMHTVEYWNEAIPGVLRFFGLI